MGEHDREAARMREAAESALSQLDGCIRHFERERRTSARCSDSLPHGPGVVAILADTTARDAEQVRV